MDSESRLLAADAERKLALGERLTKDESRAKKRVDREREEALREAILRAIPKGLWLEYSGVNNRTLHVQSDRYRLGLRGRTVDLTDFLPRLQDMLRRNSDRIDCEIEIEDDPRHDVARHRASLLQLEFEERSGRLRDVTEVHQVWDTIARHIRRGMQMAQKSKTVGEACEVMAESLDEADNELASLLNSDD